MAEVMNENEHAPQSTPQFQCFRIHLLPSYRFLYFSEETILEKKKWNEQSLILIFLAPVC